MNANINYIGILNMLRYLEEKGAITKTERRKIAEHIAIKTGANIVVSSQVKWAKFRHKVYQCRGEVSPGSIPAEKVSL